jgi:glutamate/tyrosine decarboxylase-like PLP-dependent enzyme
MAAVTFLPPLRTATAEVANAPASSLDPVDWAAFRRSAHAALDAAVDHLEGVAERPVWRPVPAEVKAAIAAPLPFAPQGLEATLADVERLVMPYGTGNTHPRFFGWVHGSGTAGGIVAEAMGAALNANVGGREHAAVYVERQVIAWARELFGLPAAATGLLVSGTSMATLIALTVARNTHAGHDVRHDGLGEAVSQLVAYTSQEAHSSVAKAFELLGLGRKALRAVPVDRSAAMDIGALTSAIARDRADGLRPFAVIATAGTVNTGGIDPLATIADVAAREGLWLHVDGAFGAAAILSPTLAPRLAGIERADSIAFDFHKWLHVPYDAGCVLVRDGAAHRAAFSTRPSYLVGAERGIAAGEPWFCEFGPDLSRSFRALKVWFTLKEHGLTRLGAAIERNCEQAAYLARLIEAAPALELLAPVTLNIACFRYHPPDGDPARLDALNDAVVVALHERGIAAPSTTRIGGRLAIRVNITNHRTRSSDLDALVAAVVHLGEELDVRPR